MIFAIAGNPNSGKTTLFNKLTGSSAHVGNWPGVTIDKKEGTYDKLPQKITVLDLPGIYSLSPYSPEEIVARTYLLDQRPDAIINIVDATNLERNLYLTTQLAEIDCPIIVALNMMDEVERAGDTIDIEALERSLGLPVVQISAVKGRNLKALMERAYQEAQKPRKGYSVIQSSYIGNQYAQVFEQIKEHLPQNTAFYATKFLEGDSITAQNNPNLAKKVKELTAGDIDYEAAIADARYRFVSENCMAALKRGKGVNKIAKSDKIDRVLTHRIWGIPIFLGLMLSVFHIIFGSDFLLLNTLGILKEPIPSPGVFLQNGLGMLTGLLIDAVANLLAGSPAWVSGLIVDGILGGIDAILSFLPQMLLLFLFLSILEDSGYMARVAFIMDRMLRRFGLSGRAFLPLLMCFGCGVPGIMATRALENQKERDISITIAPFFSCGAKLPIWAVFAATVFAGKGGELVVLFMYLLGIAVSIIVAIIMKLTIAKGQTTAFIMELPPYRRPQFGTTMRYLWDKLAHYFKRVTTVIAGGVIIIWFLQNFNFAFQMVDDSGSSILGTIGKFISPIFAPLGFGAGEHGWKFVMAAFTGLIAKEMVVSTLGVLSGEHGVLDAQPGELAGTALGAFLAGSLSIPAALSFMAFNLLSVPCMASVAAARGELKSGKRMLRTVLIWLATSYSVSLIIYWVGTYWWLGAILASAIVALLVWFFIATGKKRGQKPAKRGNEK